MKKAPNQSGHLAGQLWIITLGLFLILIGSIFVWYLWAVFKKSGKMDDWVKTPCVIEQSAIDDSGLNQHYGTKYALISRYSYVYDGQSYSGDRYSRIQPSSSDQKKIETKLKNIPVSTETVCFVNPANPQVAVLERDKKGSIFSIWFPGVFILGGLGMIISSVRQMLQR